MRLVTVWLALAAGACGANQAGLKAQAASDMSCKEEDVETTQVRDGYSGDDFGARFEVECGESKALYEKKGPGSFAAIEDTEVMPDPEDQPQIGEGEGEDEPSEE